MLIADDSIFFEFPEPKGYPPMLALAGEDVNDERATVQIAKSITVQVASTIPGICHIEKDSHR